jgi:hypothetical protein
MKKLQVLFLIFSGALIFNACTKTGPTGPAGANGSQGNPGPVLTGTITGHVILLDQYGSILGESKAGSRIILYNSAMAVVDSLNADSAGVYTISNVSTGIYTLAFRDTNFGQELHENLEFTGGGTLNVDGRMSRVPNFNITIVNADSVNHATQNVVINCSVTANTRQRTFLIFVGNTAVTSSNPANYLFTFNQNLAANKIVITFNIPLGALYSAGLTSGSTAYFAIYGAASAYNSSSSYEDFNTTRNIYNAITTTSYSPLPSVVLP